MNLAIDSRMIVSENLCVRTMCRPPSHFTAVRKFAMKQVSMQFVADVENFPREGLHGFHMSVASNLSHTNENCLTTFVVGVKRDMPCIGWFPIQEA